MAHRNGWIQIGERREVGRVRRRSRRQTIEPSIHDNFSAPTRGRCEKLPTTICDWSKREIAKSSIAKNRKRQIQKPGDFAIGKCCRKRNPVSSAHGLQSLARSRFVCVIIARLVSRPSRRPLRGACGDLDRRSRSRPRHWRAGSAEQCLMPHHRTGVSRRRRRSVSL